jgi:Family of unknown function (DUF6065)/Cupin-like domain
MSRALETQNKVASPLVADRRLDVGIYQLADDRMLKENRKDGTGWDWCWADYQRDWMDATQSRYAYRCLPLTIANQTGLWIKNPVGFTATWHGHNSPESLEIQFGDDGEDWKKWVISLFGSGIITWNTPFLFRTKPAGSRLLVSGPANYFKDNAHPLTAIIESDWISMSFTMNWKIMRPNDPVRFEVGEPLFQAIPLLNNACSDLEGATITYRKLDDDPELARSYREWDQSRRQFQEQSKAGQLKGDDWQRDYFLGRDASGRQMAPVHMTKVKPPKVKYDGSAKPPKASDPPPDRAQAAPKPRQQTPQEAPDPMPVQVNKATASGPSLAENGTVVATAGVALARPQINDEWRRWIAENLLLGAPKESVVNRMIADGLPGPESAIEVDRALQSPYLKAAERMQNRLKKRDWLLGCYRKLNRLRSKAGEIERRHKLSRGAFLDDYYSTSRPVIITGMMDDWPAMQKWNLDYFAQRFGTREVDVQIGRNAAGSANYEADREKFRRKMNFAEFIEMVRTSGVTNDFYITAGNNSSNKDTLPELWEDIVQMPEYLNGASHQKGFFWFGPSGTITPFHHDLTNNFMAQVMGRKRVKIAPSWDMPLMRNLYHVYCEVDGRATPPAPQPALGQPQILECILNPGEILFLPIGCLHYVEGLDISVTMSFTNFAFDDNDFVSTYETFKNL